MPKITYSQLGQWNPEEKLEKQEFPVVMKTSHFRLLFTAVLSFRKQIYHMQGMNHKQASTARLLDYMCLYYSHSCKVYSVIVQGQPSELQAAIAAKLDNISEV